MGATTLGRERSQRSAAAKAVGRWSTSARWEGCTKATAVPRIRHILRDVEEQQGLYRAHSNELIDPAMTGANLSFRPVVEADGSIRKERVTSVEEVFDRLEESLEKVRRYRTVPEFRMVTEKDADGKKIPELDDAGEPVLDKKGKPVHKRRKEPMPNAGARVPVAMRKDTVVAVEELFQLDPEYTGSVKDMTPEMRVGVQRLYDVWYADLVDQYGAHNVLCVSEHWDETSPHVSAFCMPLAERADGTAELNAKLFLTGKKDPTRTEARDAYVAKHDRLREALRGAGYDATFERITPRNAQGFAEKGAPLANFKRAAKRATTEEREGLAAERAKLEARSAGIDAEVATKYQTHVAEHAEWWKSAGAPKFKARIEGKVRGEMADQVRGAQEQAREIVGGARAKADEIVSDAATRAEQITTEARAEWERDEKPRLAEATKAGVQTELAGYKETRKSEIDQELQEYADEQRAKIPVYDPQAAEEHSPAELIRNIKRLDKLDHPDDPSARVLPRAHAMGVAHHKADRSGVDERTYLTETSPERRQRTRANVNSMAPSQQQEKQQKKKGFSR